ncbi:MAG: aldo/keto reductase, partial [Catenulispora sp.]|nr:aldo/keto reductase [Catenulispora sp.]
FHQEPAAALLPAFAEHNFGVIVRVALDEGGLTGRIDASTVFPEGDFRERYFAGERRAEVGRRARAITDDLGIEPDELAGIALRYALADPAVSTVIPGMRTVRNVERNVAISDGVRLDEKTVGQLAKHRWERNFYRP